MALQFGTPRTAVFIQKLAVQRMTNWEFIVNIVQILHDCHAKTNTMFPRLLFFFILSTRKGRKEKKWIFICYATYYDESQYYLSIFKNILMNTGNRLKERSFKYIHSMQYFEKHFFTDHTQELFTINIIHIKCNNVLSRPHLNIAILGILLSRRESRVFSRRNFTFESILLGTSEKNHRNTTLLQYFFRYFAKKLNSN